MSRWLNKQVHRHPYLYRAARGTLFTLRRFFPPVTVQEIPGRIHPNDSMARQIFPGNSKAYMRYAMHSKLQFEIISELLRRAGRPWADLRSVIDFGCGYGRFTRWLPTVLPPRKITACDIEKEAVMWCAKEFGVRPLLADRNVLGTKFETYDLLIALSVATHMSPRRIESLFQTLSGIIRSNGMVILTAHGISSARTANRMRDYINPNRVLGSLQTMGHAFIPYPHYTDREIGDTFLTKHFVVSKMASLAPDFELLHYDEAKFWDIQDCYVFRKG